MLVDIDTKLMMSLTGDDCVSIGDHTSNIVVSYVKCSPGHGIRSALLQTRYFKSNDFRVFVFSSHPPVVFESSIGSLGRSGNFVQVENIHVTQVYLQGTTNGARIKTWQVPNENLKFRKQIRETFSFNLQCFE